MCARKLDEAKREEIAMGALAVLRARGMHRTTMAEIARALEIKRPTLYWYFPDIESIFVWILDHTYERAARFIAESLIGVDHPLDALLVLISAQHEFFASEGLEDFTIFLAQFLAMGSHEDRERFQKLVGRNVVASRGLLIAMIEQGIAEGRVAPVDAGQLVDFMQTVLDGSFIRVSLYPDNSDIDALLAFTKKTVLDPLRRKP